MYDARYGTDWDSLDTDEVLERAFALGVADACGEQTQEEYDRLLAELDAYDRSIVELAFHEGRTEALELRADADSDDDVWNELVDEEFTRTEATPPDRDGGPPGPVDRGPPSVVRRIEAIHRGKQTDLPRFLRRD